MAPRPTLRCLREDLNLPLPNARTPLDEIDYPVLRKAAEPFAARDTPHERINSIDDAVLFKVKAGRWRGAVYLEEPAEEIQEWLVAAGTREEGAPDDFYAALYGQARSARQHYNAEHDKPLTTDTYTGHFLPGDDGRDRHHCTRRRPAEASESPAQRHKSVPSATRTRDLLLRRSSAAVRQPAPVQLDHQRHCPRVTAEYSL